MNLLKINKYYIFFFKNKYYILIDELYNKS